MENFKFLSGKIPDELYSLSHEVDVPIKFLTDQRRIIDDVNLRVDILVNERYEKFKFLK